VWTTFQLYRAKRPPKEPPVEDSNRLQRDRQIELVLLEKIDALLGGEIEVEEFEAAYYDFYLESVPEDALTDRQHEFFGMVQEKLDWTAPSPGREDRRYGWIDHEEYVVWLREQKRRYLEGETLSFR
jgi:hypothetical protein